MTYESRIRAAVLALLGVVATGSSVRAQDATTNGSPPRLVAASIVEREIDVGVVRGRTLTAWIEPEDLPDCGAGSTVRFGFLLDPLETRPAAVDTLRPFTPDARLEIACDADTGRWRSSFGRMVAVPESAPGRLEVRVEIEDLPAVDLLWVAYASDGERAWFLPDPGPSGLGPAARFSIYEIAKW